MYTRQIEIDELTELLKDELEASSPELRAAFETNFRYGWIHHENALEGTVLNFPEIHGARTQPVITDLANVTLYKKIRAHFSAIDLAYKEAKSKRFGLNLSLFQNFYETLYFGMDRDKGKFRHDIPLHRTYYHDILPPEKIADGLDALIQETKKAEFKNLHPMEAAATFGYRFMQIFPWSEASGTVGRLCSNILLLRANYFPVVVHAQDRERYYACLKRPTSVELQDMLAESMLNCTGNSLKLLAHLREELAERAG